ncbi:MAG: acetyl-CoA acetyltransferase [Pseudomonadota bacterium]
MNPAEQIVLIGVAQQCWKDRDRSRTPMDALQAVTTQALSDSSSEKVIGAVDAMVHVPFLLNQVPEMATAMPRNPGAAVAERLGISPKQYTADVGGNLPQHLVNEFARRLRRGAHKVVMISGVELLSTFLGSLRSGDPFPDWTSGVSSEPEQLGSTPAMSAPTELIHQLYEPINVYPLFESALRHAKSLSRDAHQSLLGRLVSSMSDVSADNPYAWKRERLTPEQVVSTDNGNRMISYPYTKLMNAIINVDQAAAIVMTTAKEAAALGVDSSRWVYLRGGASVHDSWFLSERTSLHSSPALEAAGQAALERSGLALDELSHFDLYSCFPSAVQVACDALGLAIDDPRGVTVTGGLTLFGGPGNNYTLHAIASMVERLRETGEAGLVSANGGYLTKHAVGVYSAEPGGDAWGESDDGPLQAAVDSIASTVLADAGEGAFTIDAHTVSFSGDEPRAAITLGRLQDGRRCAAVSEDAVLMEALLENDCVGSVGAVSHRDGMNTFFL